MRAFRDGSLAKIFRKEGILELVRYGFAGVTTTILNLAIYHVGTYFGFSYRYVNLCAILFSKGYAYLINKKVVFRTHCDTIRSLLKEIAKFVMTRGFTGLVDYFGLICLVDRLDIDKLVAKYLILLIVILLNYLLGKYVTFKKSSISTEEYTDDKFGISEE